MNRKKFEKTVTDYRKEMASYLEQIISIIKERKLSPKEVEDFEYDNNAKVKQMEHTERFFSHRCALLLTKSYFHLKAVQHANHTNNLHSVAIHTRVVLECSGQAVGITNLLKDPKREVAKRLATELADFNSVMRRNMPVNQEEIVSYLQSLNEASDKHRDRSLSEMGVNVQKSTWRYSEAVKHLEYGKNWYDHISSCFFHSDVAHLKSTSSYYGGVISCNQSFDIYSFALFLDYLVHQSLVMLLSYGLWNPNEDLFHKYVRLLEKKKESTDRYTKELAQWIKK